MATITPVSSTPAPAPVQGGVPAGEAAPAQVTSLPPSLESTDRAIVLRGEVQNVNPQTSTVTITTPRGPVDVKLSEPLPQQGQRVEVTLEPGSPPTEASVRNVQTQTAQTPLPTLPMGTPAQTQPAVTMPALPMLQEDGQTAPQPNTAQTQGPVSTPAHQNAVQATAQPTSDVTPEGLLALLKNAMQGILKTPVQNGVLGAQRPLQEGQLVRLIPAPGQAPTVPQTSAPAANAPSLPGLMASMKNILGNMTASPLQTGIQFPAGNTANQIQSMPITQLLQNVQIATNTNVTANNPLARILLPLMGFANANAAPVLTGNAGVPVTMTPASNLTALIIDVMANAQTVRAGQTVSGPVAQLPQMQMPTIDVRMAGTIPVLPNAAQNPGVANLLHGTPSLPVLFGQIAGQTEAGLPIIQLPVFSGDALPKMVSMTLQFPAKPMAPGTWVRMDVMQTGATPAQTISPAAIPGMEWEAVDDMMTTLRIHPEGQAALQLAQNALPKPGAAAFTAPVLMFLAAARGGDVTSWLGERVTDTVRNVRRADILAKLTSAMATATRASDDATPTSDWKTISLPMLSHDQNLAQIQMHYRSFERDGDGQQETERQNGSRFVLDLSLTRIGPLQIDGLSVGKQLDVTLRSEQSFSPSMREAMRAQYTDALGGIGFSGQLNFKADGDHKGWVDFRQEDIRHAVARV